MLKNYWIKVLAVFVLFFVIALGNIARGQTPTPTPPPGHTITINNNCSQTIWVGIQPQVLAVTIQATPQPTPPTGFELDSGDNAVAIAPLAWPSARSEERRVGKECRL